MACGGKPRNFHRLETLNQPVRSGFGNYHLIYVFLRNRPTNRTQLLRLIYRQNAHRRHRLARSTDITAENIGVSGREKERTIRASGKEGHVQIGGTSKNTSSPVNAHTVHLICAWCSRLVSITKLSVLNHATFFQALGKRVRKLRQERHYSQEDMISFGFSARHWQEIEAGRPVTATTLLRICGVFKIRLHELVRGLDNGVYGD